MAIEIVDFPIKNCDFPLQTVSSPEGSFLPAKFGLQNFRGFMVNLSG